MLEAIREFFSTVKEAGKDALAFAGKLTEAGAEELLRCHAITGRGERSDLFVSVPLYRGA